MTKIFKQIQDIRRSLGMTRDAFCKAIGVHPTTYSFWEHEKREPKPRHLTIAQNFQRLSRRKAGDFQDKPAKATGKHDPDLKYTLQPSAEDAAEDLLK